MINRDDRILEEATGISDYLRIRQLTLPDTDDCFADIMNRRMRDPFSHEHLLYRTIGCIDVMIATQLQVDSRDDILILRFIFKNAIPVSKLTFLFKKHPDIACPDLNSLKGMEYRFEFDAIRTNILHRCSSHRTGDQG